MENYKHTVASLIASQLEGMETADVLELLEYPPNPQMGDLSMPCFRLSKTLRKAPLVIAEELQRSIPTHEAVERIEATAGYLNIFLQPAVFAKNVLTEVLSAQEQYGSQNLGQGRKIVIDYSSPNIAKHFHIGHLRSTMIGNALYQIYSFLGYKVIGVNHLGDWGTQFGKLMVAYRLWGEEAIIKEDGVTELQRLYVKFHEEAEEKPELDDEARAWFVKLEQGDAEANRLWKWFVDISLQEYNKIYELLGVKFDSFAGESFYNDKMAEVIQELNDKNMLEQDEGATLIRLDDYNMPPALMMKKDGSTLYHTRDVAAALYRKKEYDFAKSIYVVGSPQNLHFQQIFKIVELMGYSWAEDMVHVGFGQVSLEGAKLATRKGNVIMLEDLLRQSVDKIREIMDNKHSVIPNKDEVARQVGVGAIIFNDLSTNRLKDVVFSWEEALNTEGETGPYVQYTHARACSVLLKAGELPIADSVNFELLSNIEAVGVAKELYFFVERIEQAMNKLEPSVISRYLVDLAQAFNRFYHECPILKAENEEIRAARLVLVQAVKITLRNGLKLIGLEAPEQI
ncbi:arginine--tRNA ligase [Paenibacillus psychroresistens]|uniref:Arginine--tRNA ligase n=1 Tax=Paenibacillus psychroresistens TaxID=1778678 RepID=A0A6B8RMV8_9BACL|nr:arginine--tRNA ligase [Paenibacillus psychroresistens]QGQ97379.1 arginine--tRNA ligase [Paenibacillus psychroresistens]